MSARDLRKNTIEDLFHGGNINKFMRELWEMIIIDVAFANSNKIYCTKWKIIRLTKIFITLDEHEVIVWPTL